MNKEVSRLIDRTEEEVKDFFHAREKVSLINQERILNAMQKNKLAVFDFHWTTDYGYGGDGRDKVEDTYKEIFHTEGALIRPNIVSGAHTILPAVSSSLKEGSELLSLCGPLYDTMQKTIGLTGEESENLLSRDVSYQEVPLKNGQMNPDLFQSYINERTSLVIVRRSTDYNQRRAFTIQEIEEAADMVRSIDSRIPIFVDNCYDEFTEILEPTDLGVDIMAGFLIKNPGGGLAYYGGYIVGKAEYIGRIANLPTAPRIGRECGLSFGMTRQILQGLFIAPHVVSEALKGTLLFVECSESLSYPYIPSTDDPRSDIIQSIIFNDPEELKAFCEEIQKSSPVDARFISTPWEMPEYEDPVITAVGGFIEGNSIELPTDDPIRQPYIAYFQDGLTYAHYRISLKRVLERFYKEKWVS